MKIRHRNASVVSKPEASVPGLVAKPVMAPEPGARPEPVTTREPLATAPAGSAFGEGGDLGIDIDDELLDAILALDMDTIDASMVGSAGVTTHEPPPGKDPGARLEDITARLDEFNDTIETFVGRLKDHGENLTKELRIILCEMSSPFIADAHDKD